MNTDIKIIQDNLVNLKLEAFLVTTKYNRFYLSGFTGSKGSLLITRTDVTLFVDPRYFLRAKKETRIPIKSDELLKIHLRKFKKVVVEDQITLREYDDLNRMFGRKLLVLGRIVEELRSGKTKQEIMLIQKGSRIIDKTFERVKGMIKGKKGIAEIEIVHQIEKLGKSLGAEAVAFDPIVAFGPNAAAPHHSSSTQKIGKNNFLLLDFGFKVNGYHSDFTRTLFVGKPNNYQERIYNAVLNAQLKALNSVKIGVQASDVHKTAVEEFAKQKLDKYFTHNTGHGVGLEIHELPSLASTSNASRGGPNFSAKSEDVLDKNMVVTVEPGLYFPGKFGVRIEDMVLVADKPKVFSKVPKDFKSMIIR